MDSILMSAEALRKFSEDSLQASGLAAGDAVNITDVLIQADLRGVMSHGTQFLPRYCGGFLSGGLNAEPQFKVVRERGAVALIDGDNGLGHMTSHRAMEMAIERARSFGVGVVGVRNSNHFGPAAYYAMMALKHDMIGHITTNGPAVMPPFGGKELRLSNNPVAWAIPAGEEPNIVLDMACTASAREKIRLAAQAGKELPAGWAADKDGQPTTDANTALDGFLLPIGGPKGYGLAVVHEVLSACLTGAYFGSMVSRQVLMGGDHDPWRVGHFVMALDPDATMPVERFKARVDELIRSLRSAERVPGSDRIYLPGEIEHELSQKRMRDGIPIMKVVADQLDGLAKRLGVSPVQR